MGAQSLRNLACCDPSLPGKAIKLFFSPLPKTLSPSFYWAPVSKGQISATLVTKIGFGMHSEDRAKAGFAE